MILEIMFSTMIAFLISAFMVWIIDTYIEPWTRGARK